MKNIQTRLSALWLAVLLLLSGCDLAVPTTPTISLSDIPEYSGAAYVVLQDNQPDFTEEDRNAGTFEEYSPLDALGRCGVAFANISVELMPTEARGAIGMVKPSGWHTVRYDDLVDGKYLYNRCHLIGFQLAGENANECNLITGTRYLNVVGMLPFENQVADYVKETENHVLYRVTPVFQGTELVARGVQMEAWSIEDEGEGICFNVYVYNVQPGVTIDYATGESWRTGEDPADVAAEESVEIKEEDPAQEIESVYVLNVRSKRFHLPDCSGANSISESNRETYTGTREALLELGYTPCGQCKP
jgi:DNA-entry nuclease